MNKKYDVYILQLTDIGPVSKGSIKYEVTIRQSRRLKDSQE